MVDTRAKARVSSVVLSINKGERMSDYRLISLEDARDAIDAAIAERGENYRYPVHEKASGCEYVTTEGRGDCGVGVCLLSWGVPAAFFWEAQGNGDFRNTQEFDRMENEVPGLKFTPEAVRYLTEFQFVQDAGNSWGYAKMAAESRVGIES